MRPCIVFQDSAVHGKENGGKAHALAIGLIDLPYEVIEGIQINAADRNPGSVDGQELAPHFFLGCVQADNDYRVWVHCCLDQEYRKLRDVGELDQKKTAGKSG